MTWHLTSKYCRSLWPIFHGRVILPYILKTIWYMNTILWDYEFLWLSVWPKNKCRSLWPILYFLVQWICLISWKLFSGWTLYRPLLLCWLRVSQYYYLRRSNISFLIFICYIYIFYLHSTQSMSKMVNMKQRVSWGEFSCLHVFSIIFATAYVEVKCRCSQGSRIVCFGYVHVLPEVRKSSKQQSKIVKVITSFDCQSS